MRKLVVILVLTMVGGLAHAKKNCTDQPKDKGMTSRGVWKAKGTESAS